MKLFCFVLFKASHHEVKHYNMKIKTIKKSSLIYWSNVFCKLFKIVDRSKIKDKEFSMQIILNLQYANIDHFTSLTKR
jgi:hypothetical protein